MSKSRLQIRFKSIYSKKSSLKDAILLMNSFMRKCDLVLIGFRTKQKRGFSEILFASQNFDFKVDKAVIMK